MSENEQEFIEKAEAYIKNHKNELIKRFANLEKYCPVENPVSLFMAGSPGAGKTEISKRLIEQFANDSPVRIDADDIREMFPNYTGANSHIFQRACTTGVHKLFDYVLDHKLNVILDGTFAYEKAMKNIERSLKHDRRIIIYYLFQDPAVAWKFTKIREETEGRRVSKDVFIRSFLRARENIQEAKSHFGEKIELNIIIKDFTKNIEKVYPDVERIDKYLPKVYTEKELEKIL
ncbi:MAG: zeta toxin family protein [Candidatus Moranbacteria bacterium]|nr:zeta toxin family protein [Candidatus Moranbacteria bacterium]